MSPNVPPEFFDAADRVINLANEMTRTHGVSRVSAIVMYAAARYNAHAMIAQADDVADHREEAVEYLVGQYRKMIEEHLDEMLREVPPPP